MFDSIKDVSGKIVPPKFTHGPIDATQPDTIAMTLGGAVAGLCRVAIETREKIIKETGKGVLVVTVGVNIWTLGRASHACINVAFAGDVPFLNPFEAQKLTNILKFRTAFLN